MTDDFIGVDQKIPDGWIHIMFLGELGTAIGQVLNLGLVSWAVAQVTLFGGCGFLFNRT